MFARPLLAAFLLLLGPALPRAMASDSMRCGSRIVTVEARAADVLAACGEPDFRDVYSYPGPRVPGEVSDVEQWTYNFGRNQLLHVLRLRHGRLVDIRTDGYGFAPGSTRRCAADSILEGLSKYRLLANCGEPFTRRTVGYVNTLQPRHRHRHGGFTTSHGHIPVEVFREEWIYNFGSSHFLKVVTLEDGVVAEVDNGERGFNPR
ncbi:MAG: DUF2845 domain-containing protein [Panacagrimonas sp.]